MKVDGKEGEREGHGKAGGLAHELTAGWTPPPPTRLKRGPWGRPRGPVGDWRARGIDRAEGIVPGSRSRPSMPVGAGGCGQGRGGPDAPHPPFPSPWIPLGRGVGSTKAHEGLYYQNGNILKTIDDKKYLNTIWDSESNSPPRPLDGLPWWWLDETKGQRPV